MEKQNQGFSMDEVMQLMRSPTGKQLIKLLQNSDDPALQKAKKLSADGNMDAAKEALQQMAVSEEIRKLLSQLGG